MKAYCILLLLYMMTSYSAHHDSKQALDAGVLYAHYNSACALEEHTRNEFEATQKILSSMRVKSGKIRWVYRDVYKEKLRLFQEQQKTYNDARAVTFNSFLCLADADLASCLMPIKTINA